MSIDVSDLRATIIPKSDQLNAEQLLGGEMTITVSEVTVGGGEDQPVAIHYHGDAGRPFKPCKTMRKLLIVAWGQDGREWVGKSMTLYNDPAVRFGGMDVGGIRISHLSHIKGQIKAALTATKGKKALYTVDVLRVVSLAEVLQAIKQATGRADMAKAREMAEKLIAPADVKEAQAAYAAKVAALKKATGAATASAPLPAFDLAAGLQRINTCTDMAVLQLIGDEVQDMPEGDAREQMLAALMARDEALSS